MSCSRRRSKCMYRLQAIGSEKQIFGQVQQVRAWGHSD
jgi:hypothetical protein